MKQLLIATTNPGKLTELKKGLESLKDKIQFVTLNDVRVENKPKETGKTFQENALLKAKYYADITALPTVADDGGLTIPYLKGGPGVLSRRWPGYEASDAELIDYCLLHLRNVQPADRTAYLAVNLCFFNPLTAQFVHEEEKIKGRIALVPSKIRIHGYPFRSLFIVKKYGKYYDELTEKEHHQINHRLIAAKRLAKRLKDLI